MSQTRGPRTPEERATDAARTAATLFEKLPSSQFGDEYLKPLASLLRFLVSGTAYLEPGPKGRDLRTWAELERQFLDVMCLIDRDVEFMPLREALKVDRLAERLRRDMRNAKAIMAAHDA